MTIRTSPVDPLIRVDPIACGDCAIGRASGAGRGQFCPFITRSYQPGQLLCLAGDPVERVWFVQQGVIGLSRSRAGSQAGQFDALCVPGGIIGLECLFGGHHVRSARALSNARLCGATRDGLHAWLLGSDERAALVMRALLADPVLVEHAGRMACLRLGQDEDRAAISDAGPVDRSLAGAGDASLSLPAPELRTS